MCFRQDIGSQPERRTLVRLRYRLCQLLFLFFLASPAYTQVLTSRPPRIEAFSPRGVVKQVRQVQVRFSEQMVSFGDPGVVSPFEIRCPEKGRPAWVDGLNWVYDFERVLPAGIQCGVSTQRQSNRPEWSPGPGPNELPLFYGRPRHCRVDPAGRQDERRRAADLHSPARRRSGRGQHPFQGLLQGGRTSITGSVFGSFPGPNGRPSLPPGGSFAKA